MSARILELLGLTPSAESVDYVTDKGQFHLHSLLTEQRHPATRELSFAVEHDAAAGLRQILAVEDDIVRRLEQLAAEPAVLERLVAACERAMTGGRRIYVYGCGATGRLAKQVESALWRPFWRRLRAHPLWPELAPVVGGDIEERLVGEMTGGDRALVASLEGFEDLMLLGELQLRDHAIGKGDVVLCVTEGGETSSVIGTILAARRQYGNGDSAVAAEHLFFAYNNPDEVLRPFERSARVLDDPGITKLRLATGPQAITGSTRMQATTIETFVVGVVLEEAISRVLASRVSPGACAGLGPGSGGLVSRLGSYCHLLAALRRSVPELARLTELEADTYRRGRFATYYAEQALIAVFIDAAERSPTFRLFPLDPAELEPRRSWVQVWTAAEDGGAAWRRFLGRPFHGLDPALYRAPLAGQVGDPYLRAAALESLERAGDDQQHHYDFSFSQAAVARRGPAAGDLGVLVTIGSEAEDLGVPSSPAAGFAVLCRQGAAAFAHMHVGAAPLPDARADVSVAVELPPGDDPLQLRAQIAVKVLLNAHSTAVMARLGRVVGNTMTNVSPSNLKLIGRATFLIQSHVNDVVAADQRITFEEANAVLYDAVAWVRGRRAGQTAEVGLSIVRIVETLRSGVATGWEQAAEILRGGDLARYLRSRRPAAGS